jgi:hypothetical protein
VCCHFINTYILLSPNQMENMMGMMGGGGGINPAMMQAALGGQM